MRSKIISFFTVAVMTLLPAMAPAELSDVKASPKSSLLPAMAPAELTEVEASPKSSLPPVPYAGENGQFATGVIPSSPAAMNAPEDLVKWKVSQIGDELVFTGQIASGWHVYSINDKNTPASLEFSGPEGYVLSGTAYEKKAPRELDGSKVFFDEFILAQKVDVSKDGSRARGTLTYQACNDRMCTPPIDWDFDVALKSTSTVADPAHSTPIQDPDVVGDGSSLQSDTASGAESRDRSTWALILEAILWGFAMLLTPCVFPMVPMTISFFMKGSSTPASGRFKAFMYGVFIILLYTIPICAIICITWVVGGETVTADIFNWLSTHWLPNIIFFAVFMVFAASFFGAFEITLPSSLVNKSDSKSDKKGLAGVFFMALTLVLVSFSCTGPIVGSVLIKSTHGEFWTPMVTMLAFSVAFALPFTLLAMFPSLLKKMKSGSWLNSVKVVLGFIEVALGFKFLSIADQTYHWGLLDREVYLAIWITVFSLMGLYLLGRIRFYNDEKLGHIGVTRLALAIATFSFVVYMIPGMWGAPLKALSGYLPPMETQDFIVFNYASGAHAGASDPGDEVSPSGANDYGLELPLGLQGYFSLDEALEQSRKVGRPVFVDITGHGCVNCREMEQRVWSDPEVLDLLRNRYVIVALYTDDKSKLPEDKWVTTSSGKVLKDLGRVNSLLVRERFGVNAQPNYALLDSKGNLLAPIRGYNLDARAFADFLKDGLLAYKPE